jgi:hypothetical protein
MDVRAFFLAAALAGAPVAALADEPTDPGQSQQSRCFEIATKRVSDIEPDYILIDQCNGHSWVLVRAPVAAAKKDEPATFTYEWHPVLFSDHQAELAMPSLSPSRGAPK